MTESGATPLGNEPGEGTGKPTWRSSASGSQPPAPPRPAAPADEPADEPAEGDEPEDSDVEFEGTLIQTPPEPKDAGSGSEHGDHTMVSTPGADTTMALAGDLPEIPGITLTRELGRGGMGVVYEGKQGYLDRRVAVKFLGEGNLTTEFMRRFQREAKILASLNHPHVVGCYQAGVAKDGRCFLVMEYIDGPTLGEWIEEHGALPEDRAVSVCRSVASALAYAYGSGIIHRDVKPPNVLLKTKGNADPDDPFPYQPMLADLGLARASGEVPTLIDITMQGLTAHGAVMGSPPTMAPEQFDSPDEVDFRTDIYGLGCVLFHSLTGKLAFPQGTLTKLISRKASGSPPDPREMRKDMSPQLAALVTDMLAPSREDRPATYAELLRRFEGPFLPGKPERPKALVYGAAAAVLLVGGWATWRALAPGDPDPDSSNGDSETARLDDEPVVIPGDDPDEPTEPADDAESDADDPQEPERLDDDVQDGTGEPARDGDPPPHTGENGAGTETDPADDGSAQPTDDVQELPDEPLSTGEGDPPLDEPADEGDGAATDPGTETETSSTDTEPDALVLPTGLEPIRAGELRNLMSDDTEPLRGWTASVGELGGWGPIDERNSTSGRFTERGAAQRPLPAHPWVLTGKTELVRSRIASDHPRRVHVVIVLDKSRGILLEQSMLGGEVRFTGAWAVPHADGGWGVTEEIPELSLSAVTEQEYFATARPIEVRTAWTGSELTVSWALAGGEGEQAARLFLHDDLVANGTPIGFGIEVENGAGRLLGFVVEGL